MLDISVSNYLDLARSTRDPKVIERATRIAVYARDDAATRETARLWIEIDPESPDARQVLAIMAVRDGNIDEVLEHLNILLDKTDGKIDQKLWMIANMLGREEDQEAVIAVMEKLMAERDDDPQALFAYSHVIARLGNLDRARELLERVLVLTPNNVNVALSYVSILQRQDKVNEAITWLENNLKEHEDDFNLRLVLVF